MINEVTKVPIKVSGIRIEYTPSITVLFLIWE